MSELELLREALEENRRSMFVAMRRGELELAEAHNAWMEATPFDEIARIFGQFGEAPPELFDLEFFRHRLAEAEGKQRP
jgi:hypothetical protein